ncbi:MAG: hypothetical protein KME07_07270 [Pegethrix bostrychoides GSE-TBD4-15B]|jgi:hypothetical protein|uniref:Uncharacterized protein n=1 Tax=Pegethrix bostrychoides GSE-TBD4-15B TaxID=2839662 RepID=A0A951U4B5_9CYAN|nr:hypothetical protein [Pegethrix bostrychoides GSE-TBD4-15B]
MPLPPTFSDWEHFQSTLISVQNRRIRRDFDDAPDEDITTPRGSLKQACLLKDNDSAIQTLNRLWLYYIILGEAAALQTPMYTTPVDYFQERVAFKPQVTLFFEESRRDVQEGYRPIKATVSIRIKNERYNTFSEAEARSLATRIKNEFANGTEYRWQKGRLKMTYRDPEKDYLLIIAPATESIGKALITKVLSIQNDILEPDKLSISKLEQNPPSTPRSETIYGKVRRLPRKRPGGFVRFRYAEAHIWGLNKAITLVDATGFRPDAILYT